MHDTFLLKLKEKSRLDIQPCIAGAVAPEIHDGGKLVQGQEYMGSFQGWGVEKDCSA